MPVLLDVLCGSFPHRYLAAGPPEVQKPAIAARDKSAANDRIYRRKMRRWRAGAAWREGSTKGRAGTLKRFRPRPRWRPLYAAGCRRGRNATDLDFSGFAGLQALLRLNARAKTLKTAFGRRTQHANLTHKSNEGLTLHSDEPSRRRNTDDAEQNAERRTQNSNARRDTQPQRSRLTPNATRNATPCYRGCRHITRGTHLCRAALWEEARPLPRKGAERLIPRRPRHLLHRRRALSRWRAALRR
jgi:hypothetical protein